MKDNKLSVNNGKDKKLSHVTNTRKDDGINMSFEDDENIGDSIKLADISVNSINKTAGKPLGKAMNPNQKGLVKSTKQHSGPKPSKDGLTE